MASEQQQTVGDFVTLQRGTTYKGSLVGKPGPALLGLGSIEPGGGFRNEQYQTYGGDCPANLMCLPGDLYAALKGATKDGKMIGSVARVPRAVSSGRLTQDTVKLEFRDTCREAAPYLYWVLRTPQYRAYCAGHAMGSAVVALSRVDFLNYPVPPVTQTRTYLVAVLEKVEEKIDLNRRMSECLESMARAIFKAWFVDFEPVRVKMEGRGQRQQMPRPLLALFPDQLVHSELGQIPETWPIGTVADLADVVGGTTPSTTNPSFWENGTHYWATPKDLSYLQFPVVLKTERQITDSGLAQIGSGLLPAGTVLLSSRAPIGYLGITQIPVAINQGFIAIKPKPCASNLFLLLWAHFSNAEILSRANGSTFLEISKSNFRAIPLVLPPPTIMTAFTALVEPIFARIVANERESLMLTTLRDTLLPKLITGEIRVTNAEPLIVGSLT